MPKSLAVVVLCLSAWAQAVFGSDYYALAQGKNGQALRQALHQIITNHTVIPYTHSNRVDVWEALQVLDEDPNNTNNVILIYARISEPKANTNITWNREHLWPNSYGLDDTGPEFSDLFNLRAEFISINSTRQEKYYDESSPTEPPYRAPGYYSNAPLASADVNSWEPSEMVKGDIARSLFYMDVRYEGDRGSEPDLVLTDQTNYLSVSSNYMARLTILLAWHKADPVDDAERLRNERIYTRFQHNRNPFIDHPEWVDAVFAPTLTLHAGQDTVRLLWSPRYSGFRPERAFAVTGAWSSIRTLVTESNGYHVVTFPKDGVRSFYRLRSQ